MANEKRLIDANALIGRAIKERRFVFHCANLPTDETIVKTVYNDLADFIYEQPTVDAVEVVHGEWGEIYTCHGERLWGYKCSQCEQDNSKKSNYCPNCGAKMDGGNEDG